MADELEKTPYAWAVGLDVFKTIGEAWANVRNPDLEPEPLFRRAAPSSPVADDGREAAAQTGAESTETRMDAGSQPLFAVADDGLPPLPEPDLCIDASDKWWCEESVRQAQREAYEAGRAAGAAAGVDVDVKRYGCHCDLEPHMEPDGCVIGTELSGNCNYAKRHTAKEQCVYWQPIAAPQPPKDKS